MKKHAIFPALQLKEGLLTEQVYRALHREIISGKLKPGNKIPSSRHLSEMMQVSRNTIIHSLDRLIDEGYLETKIGSGTYVTHNLPDTILLTAKKINSQPQMPSIELSQSIQKLQPRWTKYQQQKSASMFKVGVGCTDLFPQSTWSRLLGRVSRHSHKDITTYNDVMGYKPLRETLADYLQTTRGVNATSERIMIVNGTQQAINLTIQVLLNPQDEVILDDPGYDGAQGAFWSRDIHINYLKSDDEGMDIPYAENHFPRTKLIYTAPSHQFPLGDTMSLTRRLQLIDWANSGNRWIFEDDYNGEFRYKNRSIQALQGLDSTERVIYSGTFSKMFYPGFRIGYLVLPESLIEAFKIAKHYADACNSFLEQAVLYRFIQEGEYAKHVRRVRKACLERKDTLHNALEQYLPHILTAPITDSGIHTVAWVNNNEDYPLLMKAAERLDLRIQSLDRYRSTASTEKALLFGFAAHTPAIITKNIEQYAIAFNQLKTAQ